MFKLGGSPMQGTLANFGRLVSSKPRFGRLRNRPTYLDLNVISTFRSGGRGAVELLFCCPSAYTLDFFGLGGGGARCAGPGSAFDIIAFPCLLQLFFISHEEVNTFQCIYEKTS